MSTHLAPKTDSNQPAVYQIRVEGQLDCSWADWFGGMTIAPQSDGNTVLTGAVVDQAALYGVLKQVRDLGMTLVSVNRVNPCVSETLEVKSNTDSIPSKKGKNEHLSFPIFLQEMVLAVWLIVKGFSPAAVAAKSFHRQLKQKPYYGFDALAG